MDPRPGYARTVKVLHLSNDQVYIQRVKEPGEQRTPPARWAKRERFNGKRGGYTLVQDAPDAGVKEVPDGR
jgi:hypothetical protein